MKTSWDTTSIIPITFSCFSLYFFGDVFAITTGHLCPPEQRDALLEFKNELQIGECIPTSGIDAHPKTKSWKNNSDCCNWEGITCNAELGEVIELNLSSSCIYGPIPYSIGKLSRLTRLFLSFNKLSDSISSSIGKLSRLTTLDISNNKIKGLVPAWLWTVPNLEYLELSNNIFIGFERSSKHKESSIRTLSMMKYLFGSNNNFTDSIPSIICALRSLITLDLSENNFNGSIPRCMRNLKSTLSDLNLRQNHLTGGFPKAIFASLMSLDVGHNQLVGKLSRSLSKSLSLEVLNVESNKINDTFPFWLSSLKKLKVLVLSSNVFHGPIRQAAFSKLQIIDISNNHFNGTLASDFFVMWNAISAINFSKNKFEGEIPNSIGTSYGFRFLNLSSNVFSGHIPRSLEYLTALKLLDVSHNKLSGEIPEELRYLTDLESLDVSHNKLSGEIPEGLGYLTYLEYMNFSHNHLEGPLPGGKFGNQSCSSFEDNMGFTGPSFEKACKVLESEEKEEEISWKATVIGFVLGLIFGFTVGYKLFSDFFSFSFQK